MLLDLSRSNALERVTQSNALYSMQSAFSALLPCEKPETFRGQVVHEEQLIRSMLLYILVQLEDVVFTIFHNFPAPLITTGDSPAWSMRHGERFTFQKLIAGKCWR